MCHASIGLSIYEPDHPKYFDKLVYKARNTASDAWTWIENQISSSTADYLLVMGHYPVSRLLPCFPYGLDW
jgi:hypothetical protein